MFLSARSFRLLAHINKGNSFETKLQCVLSYYYQVSIIIITINIIITNIAIMKSLSPVVVGVKWGNGPPVIRNAPACLKAQSAPAKNEHICCFIGSRCYSGMIKRNDFSP